MKQIICVLMLGFLLQNCATTNQTGTKVSLDFPKYDQLTYPELGEFQIPEIEEMELENGIKFFLVEDNELPVINVSVTVKTGDLLIPQSKAGLTSITGSVMRSGGTQTYNSDELNTLLEDKAASIETFVSFSSGGARMNVLKEDFTELLPVLVDVLQNPAFPEDKIDLAKIQTKSGISRRNDESGGIASREFNKLIYSPNSVYARTTEYATIDNITRDDIVAFHKKSFVGSNYYIAVIGDFDMEPMKIQLREAFSSVPAGNEISLDYPEVKYDYKSTINFVNKTDVNQSYVLMGHIGSKRNDDYAALQVMNEVLSGGFSGRLMQNVRTDMGLAYSVFGSYNQYFSYPGTFTTGVMTKSETTAEAIDAIINEIERLINEPITETELKETKERFLNSLVFRFTSKADVVYQKVNYVFRDIPEDTFEKYVEALKKVTVEDVQRVAKTYLKPDKVQILVVGNGDEIGNQLNKYGKINAIDITIPVPGQGVKMIGDASMGGTILKNMSKAIVGDKTVIGYKAKATVTQYNPNIPGGKMVLTTESTVNYGNGSIENMVQTPQGSITMRVKDGIGSVEMMGQSRPLPAAQVKTIRDDVKLDYFYLAANGSKLEVDYIEDIEIGGIMTHKIAVTIDETQVSVFVNTETLLPLQMSYSTFNPNAGGNVDTIQEFSNWKERNGVKYSSKTKGYKNGELSAVVDIESFKAIE